MEGSIQVAHRTPHIVHGFIGDTIKYRLRLHLDKGGPKIVGVRKGRAGPVRKQGGIFDHYTIPPRFPNQCQAKNLKLCVTAGIGGDHIDLYAGGHCFTHTSTGFVVIRSRSAPSIIRFRPWKFPGPTSLQSQSTS